MEQRFDRFKDAIWFPKEDINVLVGGAGGISSWLTMLLVRAGFKPTVYDFDVLEAHNLGGQLYPKSAIGKTKVEALNDLMVDFSNEEIDIVDEKYDTDSMTSEYCFAGFDNMQARKDMFENWAKYMDENPKLRSKGLFIDGRLIMEQLQIFCIPGDNEEAIIQYRKEHLFDDSEVEDAPCTMKQTSHSAAMIASHMTAFFTNHIANTVEDNKSRNVPFSWEYIIPVNMVIEEQLEQKEQVL